MKLLTDVRQAVDAIDTFTSGKQWADLSADLMLRSAAYFQFAVIGEALAQLRAIEPETAERINEHQRIIVFRKSGHSRLREDRRRDHVAHHRGQSARVAG